MDCCAGHKGVSEKQMKDKFQSRNPTLRILFVIIIFVAILIYLNLKFV